MKTIRSTIALLSILLSATANCRASEDVPVSDGGSAQITLSAKELTRIGMADGIRLGRILAPDGVLDVHPGTDTDGKPTGDAFVRPLDPTPGKAFSFFVRDEHGATYTLVAAVADVPSHTILLHRDGNSPTSRDWDSHEKSEPYVRHIKALLRAMVVQDTSGDFNRRSVGQVVPVWQQTEAVLEERWSGEGDLRGERWSFRNAGSADLQLDESQFTGLYPDIKAVAIETQALHPGASTRVFIVRGGAP